MINTMSKGVSLFVLALAVGCAKETTTEQEAPAPNAAAKQAAVTPIPTVATELTKPGTQKLSHIIVGSWVFESAEGDFKPKFASMEALALGQEPSAELMAKLSPEEQTKLKEQLEKLKAGDATAKENAEFVKSMVEGIKSTSLVFTATEMTATMGEKKKTETYSIVSEDEKTLTLKHGEEDEIIRLIDNDHITLEQKMGKDTLSIKLARKS